MALGQRSAIPALPLLLGMTFNVASVAIANPYVVFGMGIVIACWAAIWWRRKPLQWVVFASVLAANPVNLSTSVALNLLCAAAYLTTDLHALGRLPPAVLVGTAAALMSVLASVTNWSAGISVESLFSQVAAAANYVVGPFVLIPVTYARLRELRDPGAIPSIALLGLIAPTLFMLALARAFGHPVSDFAEAASQFDYLVNVSVYRLGDVDFTLTRTQVGIVLAAAICSCVAMLVSAVSRALRVGAALCLGGAVFLLLITGSVGSALASVCGIGAVLLLGRSHLSFGRYVSVGILVLTLGAGLIVAIPHGVQQYAVARYEERFSSGALDVADRSDRWLRSLEYLGENPTGVGWSLFVEPLGIYPHNDYLSYAIAFGVVCGAMYAALAAWLLYRIGRGSTLTTDRSRLPVVLAGVGVTVACVVNWSADHMTANRWYFNVVWSMIWCAYFAIPERKGNPPYPARSDPQQKPA